MSVLKSISARLKIIDSISTNGLVVCAGNTESTDNNNNNLYLFEPPNPIKQFYYKCDKKFHLDYLLQLYQMYDDNDTYAVILTSGKRTDFYSYTKNNIKLLKTIIVDLPNQHKTGGSSAPRFGRIRDEQINNYIKKIIDSMVKFYTINGKFNSRGMIIAGPAEIKDLVRESNLFNQYFTKFLQKILTISEITDNSIYEVLKSSDDILMSINDQELIADFESMLNDPNKIDYIVFGTENVLNDLDNLKKIYVELDSPHYVRLLNSDSKNKLVIVNSKEFTLKYGELIGIRYYACVQNEFD